MKISIRVREQESVLGSRRGLAALLRWLVVVSVAAVGPGCPDDDDDGASDNDPWPDADWPDDLDCGPWPSSTLIACDFILPDQYGNEIHLYEFYGRPFFIQGCGIAGAYTDGCTDWWDTSEAVRQTHADVDLQWVVVLLNADDTLTAQMASELSQGVDPPMAILRDMNGYAGELLPDMSGGVSILPVRHDMSLPDWPGAGQYQESEIPEIAAELAAAAQQGGTP